MIELIPEPYLAPLDLEKIFGRAAPMHVDLGCSDGGFLFELAQQHPEKNFLGIERLSGRVEKASRKAAKIDNMRVLKAETSYVVRYLLPQRSVRTFYLLFPDPWPKRRHHRRRIVTPDFLNSIRTALEENGTLRIATDQLDYFEQIRRVAQNHSGFAVVDLSAPSSFGTDLPVSKFERKFQAQGAPIYRLGLQKVSPVT